jgi:hypothetical protein
MGHIFIGCLWELCNTTFCIIEAGCCPLLKGLEGKKKSLMNILFINFLCYEVLIFVLKNLERLYKRIHRLMIL